MLWAMLRQGGVGNFLYLGLQRLEGRAGCRIRSVSGSVRPTTTPCLGLERRLPAGRARSRAGRRRRTPPRRSHPGRGARRRHESRGADTVRFLMPARRGGAWVATDGGVERVRVAVDGTLAFEEALTFPPGLGPVQPMALVDCGAAGLFVTLRSTRGGQPTDVLMRASSRGWRELRAVASPRRLAAHRVGRHGRAVVGGVCRRRVVRAGVGTDDGDWRLLPRMRELAGRLYGVLSDPDGGFWLATSTGLAHHVPALWRTPRELADFVRPSSTIFEARNGDLLDSARQPAPRAPRRPLAGLPPAARTRRRPDPHRCHRRAEGRAHPARRPPDSGDGFDRARGTFTPVVHPAAGSSRC